MYFVKIKFHLLLTIEQKYVSKKMSDSNPSKLCQDSDLPTRIIKENADFSSSSNLIHSASYRSIQLGNCR